MNLIKLNESFFVCLENHLTIFIIKTHSIVLLLNFISSAEHLYNFMVNIMLTIHQSGDPATNGNFTIAKVMHECRVHVAATEEYSII